MIGLSNIAFFVAVIFALIILARLTTLEKRIAALSRVDAKLDLLLKQAGIEYDPHKMLPAQIQDALQRGEKILAIKYYREATGVGLKEAKDYIEKVQRDTGTV